MKTQRINLLEAMNFALAGHEVRTYKNIFNGYPATMKLKNGYLALYTEPGDRGTKITGDHIKRLQDLEWHAGDDRTIEPYFNL
jgi:hypothetical protein